MMMNRNSLRVLLALVGVALMAGSCGGNAKGPEQVVEQCWKALEKGDVEKAVGMINIDEKERTTYCQMYADVCRSLDAAGGVEGFEVVGSSIGQNDAVVEAVVTLKSGQQIRSTYELVLVGDEWKLKE